MQESTIWTVVERAGIKLEPLFDVLKKAHSSKSIVALQEDEYQYAIHKFEEKTERNSRYISAQLIKYKKETSIESYDINKDRIETETTANPPVISYSNFVVFSKYILIEQKGRTLGQRQILNALLKFYELNENLPRLDLGFILDTKVLDEFIKSQEKITLIRFSNIVLNPDNPDKNIQQFENFIRDTNGKNTEISNPTGAGINKNSKIIDGGLKLSKMDKLNIKIESESEGEKQVFNSVEGRNKLKEKVSYENGERDKTVFQRFLQKMRELL
ncbi:MAG: hypothetical protein M1138_01295 [Candidatus Thermoplasmatota archaeon]|jgi:hypothetical protein|nr:hypothetical protein [Candidatus Thermoplasmatota archaeon]